MKNDVCLSFLTCGIRFGLHFILSLFEYLQCYPLIRQRIKPSTYHKIIPQIHKKNIQESTRHYDRFVDVFSP